MEIQFLFVTDGSLTAVREPETGTGGGFGWNSSSCAWSTFLSDRTETRSWNWRADLDGISVPVRGRGPSIAGWDPGTGTADQIWIEFQFLFVVEVPDKPVGNQELGRYVHWGAFQVLFVVQVPELPVGNQEQELAGRFRWKFGSRSWSRFLNRWSGSRDWNCRSDLDRISVPVGGQGS